MNKKSEKTTRKVKKEVKTKAVKKKAPVKKTEKIVKEKIERMIRGVVVTEAVNNTAIVSVERIKKHPVYKKYYSRSERFKVHCEDKNIKEGDKVVLKQVRPISRQKRWLLLRKDK